MSIMSFLHRYWVKLYIRIVKEKASPEYIARGWAIGMFYGCLIPFGFQLMLSIPTAFLLKGSKIGATVGTLITNHFSVFIIYPLQCWAGGKLMGINLTFSSVSGALDELIREQSFQAMGKLGTDLIIAFFIGGAILTAVMTPLTYYFVLNLVRAYRRKKEEKNQSVLK